MKDYCRTKHAIDNGLNTDIKTGRSKKHVCKNCYKEYTLKESKSVAYCSDRCKEDANEKRKALTVASKLRECQTCGKEFVSNQSNVKYCSKECKTLTKVCECCGKEFKRPNKQMFRDQKYCSRKCAFTFSMEDHEEYYRLFSEIHKGHIVPIEMYKGTMKPMTVHCVECGGKTTRNAYRFVAERKSGCSHCGRPNSTGEIAIEEWLKANDVQYVKEYKFDDLSYKQPLRFDFGILNADETLSCLIEYDGVQHFESRKQFGGEDFLQEQQMKDEMKNEYVLANDINLLRINYKDKDDIENILVDSLGSILPRV